VCANLNAIAILVFLFGMMVVSYRQNEDAETASAKVCTASDYTIQVYTMPKEAKDADEVEQKIKAFFEKALWNDTTYDVEYENGEAEEGVSSLLIRQVSGAAAAAADKEAPASPLEKGSAVEVNYLGQGKWLKAKITSVNEDKEEVEIADVNLCTANLEYLDAAKERGAVCLEVDLIVAQIRSKMDRKKWDLERPDCQSLRKKLKSALLRFEAANDKCQEQSEEAEKSICCAYVTFNDEKHMVKALNSYQDYGLLTSLVQPQHKRLDGKTVYLTRAPGTIAYTHTHTHTLKNSKHTHTHTHTNTHTHKHTHTHTHTYTHTRKHTHTHTNAHTHKHTPTYTHTHTHTHKHTYTMNRANRDRVGECARELAFAHLSRHHCGLDLAYHARHQLCHDLRGH